MKKNIYTYSSQFVRNRGFTLIEVLITITILALIFTSVMSVFIYYSTLGAKVEANRLIQSNIKNIIEHISKDIKDNGINFGIDTHDFTGLYDGNLGVLYVGSNQYYLAKDASVNNSGLFSIVPFSNANDLCGKVKDNCVLMKNQNGEKIVLSNSWVSFRNFYFHVSKDYIPKVTINFDMGIAEGKGLSESVIKANNIQIQTTISEKLLDQNL